MDLIELIDLPCSNKTNSTQTKYCKNDLEKI